MNKSISVGLPLFDARRIGWLALESLCNQVSKYKWELLIMEEEGEEAMGESEVMKYKKRLFDAGCFRLVYIPIKTRIPLSIKWIKLADLASTEFFLLQAADCYSYPKRIENTINALSNGIDWFQCNKGYFYNVNLKKTILFNVENSAKFNTGLNMATKLKHLVELPIETKWSSIDHWIFNNIQENKKGI